MPNLLICLWEQSCTFTNRFVSFVALFVLCVLWHVLIISIAHYYFTIFIQNSNEFLRVAGPHLSVTDTVPCNYCGWNLFSLFIFEFYFSNYISCISERVNHNRFFIFINLYDLSIMSWCFWSKATFIIVLALLNDIVCWTFLFQSLCSL